MLPSIVHHAPVPRVTRPPGCPRPGCPIVTDAGGLPPTSAVGCTGAVTEPARRRPFRGWLRSLRRSRDLVLAPDLPEGDVTRVVKAIDDVLEQRETNSQRAAAERVVVAYSRLDPDGRRRFLETLATRFGADSGALDRAVDTIRAARTPAERARAERALRRAVVPTVRVVAPRHHRSAPRRGLPRGAAGRSARAAEPGPGPGHARRRAHRTPLDAVRRGSAGVAPDHLGLARVGARASDGHRSGARHRRLGRPAPPPRRRPALLRVLPSGARTRTHRVRGDRAHARAWPTTCPSCSTAPTRSTTPTPRSSTRSPRRSRASPACTSATS